MKSPDISNSTSAIYSTMRVDNIDEVEDIRSSPLVDTKAVTEATGEDGVIRVTLNEDCKAGDALTTIQHGALYHKNTKYTTLNPVLALASDMDDETSTYHVYLNQLHKAYTSNSAAYWPEADRAGLPGLLLGELASIDKAVAELVAAKDESVTVSDDLVKSAYLLLRARGYNVKNDAVKELADQLTIIPGVSQIRLSPAPTAAIVIDDSCLKVVARGDLKKGTEVTLAQPQMDDLLYLLSYGTPPEFNPFTTVTIPVTCVVDRANLNKVAEPVVDEAKADDVPAEETETEETPVPNSFEKLAEVMKKQPVDFKYLSAESSEVAAEAEAKAPEVTLESATGFSVSTALSVVANGTVGKASYSTMQLMALSKEDLDSLTSEQLEKLSEAVTLTLDAKLIAFLHSLLQKAQKDDAITALEKHSRAGVRAYWANYVRTLASYARFLELRFQEIDYLFKTQGGIDRMSPALGVAAAFDQGRTRVMFAVPNTGTVTSALFSAWTNMRDYAKYRNVDLMLHMKSPAASLDDIVVDFLTSKCEWLVLCESSVVPPIDIVNILNVERPVVSAWVDGHSYTEPKDVITKVDAVSRGLVAIHASVFEKLTAPRFEEGGLTSFCESADEAGIGMWVDGRYTCTA